MALLLFQVAGCDDLGLQKGFVYTCGCFATLGKIKLHVLVVLVPDCPG